MHKSLEYHEGRAAYYDGESSNPYNSMTQSENFDDWSDGWNDAKEDEENE